MAINKKSFLPKLGSTARRKNEAVDHQSNEVQKVVVSLNPTETPVAEALDPSLNNHCNYISPGKKQAEDDDALNVTCENGSSDEWDEDEEMSVEVVNMADAAANDFDEEDSKDEDGTMENDVSEKVSILPDAPTEIAVDDMNTSDEAKKMKEKRKDDDDIDLAELKNEMVNKVKSMFRRGKSTKVVSAEAATQEVEPEKSRSLVDEKTNDSKNDTAESDGVAGASEDAKKKKRNDDDDIDLVELKNEMVNKIKTIFSKGKSAKAVSTQAATQEVETEKSRSLGEKATEEEKTDNGNDNTTETDEVADASVEFKKKKKKDDDDDIDLVELKNEMVNNVKIVLCRDRSTKAVSSQEFEPKPSRSLNDEAVEEEKANDSNDNTTVMQAEILRVIQRLYPSTE